MDRAQRDGLFSPLLRQSLDGYFTARARGLLTPELALLDHSGRELGRLRTSGASGAELRFGDHTATLEASGERLRMIADGEEMLSAGPKGGSIDEIEVFCGGQTYNARFGFFRNRAVASRPGGGSAARLSGSLTGRGYEAFFEAGDACALPVAVFLLWHLNTYRRRAYLTGGPVRGGKM